MSKLENVKYVPYIIYSLKLNLQWNLYTQMGEALTNSFLNLFVLFLTFLVVVLLYSNDVNKSVFIWYIA